MSQRSDGPGSFSGSWASTGSGLPPGGDEPPTRMPPPPPPAPEGPQRDGPAWERRRGLLDVGAMARTIGAVLFDPTATFRTMKRHGGLGGPLFYVVVLVTLGDWVALAWSTLQSSLMEGLLPMPGTGQGPYDLGIDPAVFNLASAILAPALVLIMFFLWAGLVHLFLMMFDGARQGFETTARTIAYCQGSVAVWNLIPFCGGLIGFIWFLVVAIIGVTESQETGTGKAAAAVLLPLLLCCLCIAGVVAAAVALGVGLTEGFTT